MSGYMTADEAVKIIKSGDRVFVHGVSATPVQLVHAMTNRHQELKNVEVIHLHTEGPAPYADPEYKDSCFVNALL